ncbi:protein DOG1-like 4 [Gastrolobium bilobum]|uniref:protein DOG1-like 4 n=1 Tax=Gastrolobium bilobum TaxID=150636 RepID=UPI002AB11F5F|nr:protein DOG1-like 4 [Gastrolobium bilobum]
MSMLPSSGMHLSQCAENNNFEGESFHKFFECWLAEQNQHLEDLIAAESTNQTEEQIQSLINRVVEHYEYYYKTKSRWTNEDVLAMFSPTWRSSLEEAFLWIGGWRPSMAFHLLYSKSGLQFEARLNELIQGLKTCDDLGEISAFQLSQFDELQRRTIREEREITDMMAKHQETVADASMVELSHVASEMIRGNETGDNENRELEDKVESTLVPKEEGLEKILMKGDDLRLRTLHDIVNILTPKQAIHFLIAAAELHLRLHEWGKKKDARKGNQGIGEGKSHNPSS